jgi:hypothetical protein
MSIVTLKRKSQAIHSDVSKNGFYLNGVLRLPPQNIIRTPTRTILKGTAPVGHGIGTPCRVKGILARSCGNKYPVVIHTTCCVDPQTGVKKSTMNTFSMLGTRYKGILHGAHPRSVVGGSPSKSASDITKESARSTLKCEANELKTQKPCIQSELKCSPTYSSNLNQYQTTYENYIVQSAPCNVNNIPKTWTRCQY